jgi:hypothetical protein
LHGLRNVYALFVNQHAQYLNGGNSLASNFLSTSLRVGDAIDVSQLALAAPTSLFFNEPPHLILDRSGSRTQGTTLRIAFSSDLAPGDRLKADGVQQSNHT